MASHFFKMFLFRNLKQIFVTESMKTLIILSIVIAITFDITALPVVCKNGTTCKRSFSNEGVKTTENFLLVNDVAIVCSSIQYQAVLSYTTSLGSFTTAANSLQRWLSTTYGGNWAVLYSTNFGMAFTYVSPNVCEFSLGSGVYCGLFQESAGD